MFITFVPAHAAHDLLNGWSNHAKHAVRPCGRDGCRDVASGNAGAQSPTEQAASMHQEILVNGGDFPHSETDFRLEDHQQLKDYFFGRRREPLRGDDCRSCQR
jgi:hypothetical protein